MKHQDNKHNLTRRQLFMWELRWVALEMAGVVLGLYLLLRLDQMVLGLAVLCGTLAVSFLIRFYHYLSVSRQAARDADRSVR